MASGRFHALIYGGLVVFLGPGSMFFHGSLTHYGGWIDNFSMILYVTFILCYDAFRVWRGDDRTVSSPRSSSGSTSCSAC